MSAHNDDIDGVQSLIASLGRQGTEASFSRHVT